MARVSIMRTGQRGVNADIPSHLLPAEYWTDARNVRMRDASIYKSLGHTEGLGTAQTTPYFVMPYQEQTNYYWVYAGLNKVYVALGDTHTDITRTSSDYSANKDTKWNGGVLGTIPILNNGVDVPQMWNPAKTSQPLQNLSNWPSGYTCEVMRVFKNFLVAYNITDDTGTTYPQRVKWSHPASGLAVPSSWDETDPTRLAGENDLLETEGKIVDALPMRDTNVIYKQDAIYGMQYIGGNYVFRFYSMFEGVGLLAPDCVVNVRGRQVFLTYDDVLENTTNNLRSVIDKRFRQALFNKLDDTSYHRSFLLHYPEEREVWICIPEVGEDFPTIALIWNYNDDSLSLRDLPNVTHMERGVVNVDSGTWDGDTDSWNSDVTRWNELEYSERRQQPLAASTDTALYQMDRTAAFNGSDFRAYVERRELAVAGQDYQGNLIADKTSYKVVKAVWPRVETDGGVTFQVYIGSQEELDAPISWSGPFTFDPSTDRKINCLVSGRLLAIRFESTGQGSWTLDGYDIDISKRGTY